MIQSMTGYGKADVQLKNKFVSIEIKSLNSKFLDPNIKMPHLFKEKESEVRDMLSKKLERGKIDLYINIEEAEEKKNVLNKNIVKVYLKEILLLCKELNIKNADLLPIVMRMPDVISSFKEPLNITEWKKIKLAIEKAILNLMNFRHSEGKTLQKDMEMRIGIIEQKLADIKKFETNRIEKLRSKFLKELNNLNNINNQPVNKDRFEQELIYYIEKMDITEEKVRLKSHCIYYLKMMKENASNGKKLGFIAQEIGREINTIGSKANDADIQKLVVEMKDELEKIKEQTANVL